MKRSVFFAGILTAALVVSSGACLAISYAHTAEEKSPASASVPYAGVDKTVDVVPVELDGKTIENVAISPCFATLFESPEKLLDVSNAAVYARVDNVQYFVLGGAPWNKVDVTVLDALKGDVQAGDQISIVQYGGYIPLAEQIRYSHDEDKFADMSAEEIDATVFKKTIDAAPLPQAGEQGVYFLVTGAKATPNLPLGSYEVISAYQGKYMENANGILERYAPTDGYYLTDEQRQSRSVPAGMLANGERPYTVQQMKAVLQGQEIE